MKEVGALYLSRKLESFPYITILDLSCINITVCYNIVNEIGNSGCNYICKSLKFLPELRELNIRGNSITAIGMSYFIENLQFIPKLEKLDLYSIKGLIFIVI